MYLFNLFFHLDRDFESKYSSLSIYIFFSDFLPYSILFRCRLWSDGSFDIVYVITLELLLVSYSVWILVNVLRSDFVDFNALDSLSGEVKIVNTCFHLCLIIWTILLVNLCHFNKWNCSYPMIYQCNDHEDLYKYVWRLILSFVDGSRDTLISSIHLIFVDHVWEILTRPRDTWLPAPILVSSW